MAFLRTLFWIVATMVVVIFALRNWVPVTINLFGGLQADVKLPVLLVIAFLLGFVPLYIWHRAVRWRHGRVLAVERATVAAAPVVPAPATPEPGFGPARAD